MNKIQYLNENGDFLCENPAGRVYFPLVNEAGMMSSVTPTLGGDCKAGQDAFLLAPASDETLHESRATRNFWCKIRGGTAWSATGVSGWQQSLNFTERHERVTV
ncbi:MAG: cellobiose phosphorylase, partial [Oscillospiraceae bacterium]|nr:cellobiose phosphorylase [Oscillospiraceae bacterium]